MPFCRAKTPYATKSLFLEEEGIRFHFGNMTVAVGTSDSGLLRLVEDRYGCFKADGTPDVEVIFDIATEQVLDHDRLHEARHHEPAVTTGEQGTEIVGLHFRARLRSETISIEGPRATYPIDLALAHLWQSNHPEGFILHGAGLLDGCNGWIAAGPSGCGKSTLAGLVGDHALCDEYVGVVRRQDHFDLVGLPFWTGRPGVGLLSGIHFLAHGSDHRRTPLNVDRAWTALRKQIVWPMSDSQAAQRTLDLGLEVARTVPCFELQFSPDADVWNVLRKAS